MESNRERSPKQLIEAFKSLDFESVGSRLEALRLLAILSLDYTEDRMHPREGVIEVHCCNPDVARRCLQTIHTILQETPPDMEVNIVFGVETDFGKVVDPEPKDPEAVPEDPKPKEPKAVPEDLLCS